ncbi:replication-associated protein [Crucivirus-81]|nr:replication-associated protein [Crucivirus-81]
MQKLERSGAGKIGNINQSSNPKKDNERNQRVHWFFTWNNYTEENIEMLIKFFKANSKKYIFQEEIGDLNKTKHLQGNVQLKKRMRWSEFGLPKQICWEPTRNIDKANAYCCKEETKNGRTFKFGFPSELKLITTLRPWQSKICTIINGEINDRFVYWIYDEMGENGKTVFCKYLYANQDAIIATDGANKDVSCMLAELVKNGRDLNDKTTFIFHFPRSTEGLSYKAIESVKDGLITSTKFHSNTLVFNCPHVFVFSNELPNLAKLSQDRWKLKTIINGDLFDYEEEILDPIFIDNL